MRVYLRVQSFSTLVHVAMLSSSGKSSEMEGKRGEVPFVCSSPPHLLHPIKTWWLDQYALMIIITIIIIIIIIRILNLENYNA